MASCLFPISITISHHYSTPRIDSGATTTTSRIAIGFSPSSYFSDINCQSSFSVKRKSWPGCCHATSPESESPPEEHLSPSSGIAASFSRFPDTLQIFFAVLFWMSLFFWSSAWDGRNGGRPNKGSRFRK